MSSVKTAVFLPPLLEERGRKGVAINKGGGVHYERRGNALSHLSNILSDFCKWILLRVARRQLSVIQKNLFQTIQGLWL